MRTIHQRFAAAGLALAAGLVVPDAARAYPSGDPAVARTLMQAARARGASSKVILAMFEAAVTESGMRNLTWGDRDSRGVFQIRTSIWGWSTATNVWNSAQWFLNRAIPRQNWYGSAGSLAQAVEVSAYPWRYNANEWWARAWINAVGGSVSSSGTFRVSVTTSGLNVRTGPGTGYRIVGILRYGTVVTVSAVSNGWYRISYGGYYRWISGGYTRRI